MSLYIKNVLICYQVNQYLLPTLIFTKVLNLRFGSCINASVSCTNLLSETISSVYCTWLDCLITFQASLEDYILNINQVQDVFFIQSNTL